MMEVFAGFLSHTDHHLGRLLDFLRERGDLDNTIVMVISDNGASAEGGPTGTTNEAQFFNNAPESARGQPRAHRRDRRPDDLQPLPVGLDVGRQHAVPAVEAGDLPRRRLRPVHRLLAGGHRRQGRGPRRSTRTSSTWCRPCWTCSASSRRPRSGASPSRRSRASASRRASTTPPPRATTTRSTSRCSATGPSTTTAGARSARGPGPSFAEAGMGFGQPISADKLVRARRHRLGAVPRRRGLRGEPQRRRRTTATRLIALIGTWYVEAGKYGVMPVDGSGLQRMVAEKPQAARAARQLHATSRTPSRSRSSPARGCSTGRTASPRPSRSPRAAPKASCSARARPPAATRSTSRTARCTTSTTTSPAACYKVVLRRSPCRPARTNSASSSSRPVSRTSPHGQGRARAAAALRRRRPRRRARGAGDHPVRDQPGGAHLRRQPGLTGDPGLPSPFRFTGTLHSVTVDVSGELIDDSESEMRMAMARQ